MTPEFVVVGHVVQDLLPDGGWRLGGAVAYSGLLARNLGLRTAILTACAGDLDLDELLPGIEVRRLESAQTTQIRNVYPDGEGGRREQWIPQRAERLTAADVPEEWADAPIVLLGPVAGEVEVWLAGVFSDDALIGAGAQGWLRDIALDGRVRPVSPGAWDAAALLDRVDALFLSDEDLPLEEAPARLSEWAGLVEVLAFTRGYGGADVHAGGEWRRVDAFPASVVDLTGAGDTFAAGFLAHYAESRDVEKAARFASAAASLVIEGVGVEGAPDGEAIERKLKGG